MDHCIENGILEKFLRENRAEVLGMLLEEFDVTKYERTLRSEGREEGMELGRKQGIERTNCLNQMLVEQDRMEDLKRSFQDSKYQEALFKEFDI